MIQLSEARTGSLNSALSMIRRGLPTRSQLDTIDTLVENITYYSDLIDKAVRDYNMMLYSVEMKARNRMEAINGVQDRTG